MAGGRAVASLAWLAVAGCAGDPGPDRALFEVHALTVPAAAGSLGPNLVSTADGRVVLSWIEPAGTRHRLAYSTLSGGSWGKPSVVSEGEDWFVNWADFPSVVPVSGPLWAAHWLVSQPAGGYAYDVLLSLSSDGGRSWSEPIAPHDDGTPTEHGFVTLFPRGSGTGLVWLDGRKTLGGSHEHAGDAAHGMTLRSATVQPDLSILDAAEIDGLTCDCCPTDVALTDDGAVAVYRDRTANEVRDIYVARMIDGAWQPGVPVADDGWTIDGCPVNGPVIAAEGSRVAVAWFTGAGGNSRVRVARSGDSGATFGEPIDVVTGATLGRTGIALLPDDALAVSWLCEMPGERVGVCLRAVPAAGEAGPVHAVTGDQAVLPLSVPQLARAGDSLVLAWTARMADTTRIASGRVALDSLR
jgi:hypothetical protein